MFGWLSTFERAKPQVRDLEDCVPNRATGPPSTHPNVRVSRFPISPVGLHRPRNVARFDLRGTIRCGQLDSDCCADFATQLEDRRMPQAESAWFYSSLSQVTAAIVGFVGAFLILRLQTHISDWNDLLVRLETGQTRWLLTSDTFALDSRFQLEKGILWAELLRALEEQKRAKMPSEITWGGCLLLALLAMGTAWPLIALQAPDLARKLSFLVPWGVLVLVLVSVMYLRARSVLGQLRRFELSGAAARQYEDYILQMEGLVAREEEERQGREAE